MTGVGAGGGGAICDAPLPAAAERLARASRMESRKTTSIFTPAQCVSTLLEF